MSYCTLADILALRIATEAELIQLTDAGGLGVIDESAVEAAAAAASIEIDPYLSPRMTLPLTSVPDPVRRWAAILTVYQLYGLAPTEHRQRQYEAAIKALTQVASGTLSLGVAESTVSTPDSILWGSEPAAWGRGTDGGL